MKTYFTLLILLLSGLNSFSQEVSSVDIDNPISSIKYFYNNLGQLELSITLSEIKLESNESEKFLDPSNLEFEKVIATVIWKSDDIKDKVELSLDNQSDNKFKYSAIFNVKDRNRTYFIEKHKFNGKEASHKWLAIKNISIGYEIGGAHKKIPLFDILPEIPIVGGLNYSISIIEPGVYFDENEALIQLKTEPLSIAGKLTKFKLYKGNAKFETEPNIVSSNGIYSIKIEDSPVIFNEGNWFIDAVVEINERTGSVAKTKENSKIFLKHNPKLEVLEVSDKYFVNVNGKDSKKIKIQTKGNGELKLEFIPNIKEQYNVSISSSVNDTGLYTFELNNLNNIPKDQSIYFNIKNAKGESLTKGPHLFINKTPNLHNFSVNFASKDSKIQFDLPNTVELSSIAVRLNNLGITASGDKNIQIKEKGNEDELTTYQVKFGGVEFDKLYQSIKQDTIIESSLSILVDNYPVYSINLKFLDQEYIDSKIIELAKISSEKAKWGKREEKKERIKETLNAILAVINENDSKKVSDKEVEKTVETLAEGGKRKNIENVMATIGKVGTWVGTYGPLIIPLL